MNLTLVQIGLASHLNKFKALLNLARVSVNVISALELAQYVVTSFAVLCHPHEMKLSHGRFQGVWRLQSVMRSAVTLSMRLQLFVVRDDVLALHM